MPQPKPALVFCIPLLTAVITLLLLVLAVWNGWLGQGAHVGARFGEAAHPGLIKQPVNTLSNLGFIFIGLFISWRLMRGAYSRNANPLTHNAFYSVFFPSLVVCVGPGSMAMHATETHLGGCLDLLSMYFVAAFLTAYAIGRFLRLSRVWFLLLFATVVALCVYVQSLPFSMPLVGNSGDFIFGLFIIVAALFETLNSFVRKFNHELKWCAVSLLLLLVAFFIWKLSQPDTPSYSLFQGHALWHLLCAVSAYCIFRYYVSEKSRPFAPEEAGAPEEATREAILQA